VPRGYADKNMGDHGWGDRISSIAITNVICDPEVVTVLWAYKGF
jgi:hypothetical protein